MFRYALVGLLLVAPALAQTTTDECGRTVVQTGDVWTVTGNQGTSFSVSGVTPDRAALIIANMRSAECPKVAAPVQTTLSPEAFIERFTPAEQQAIMSAAQSAWQVNLWLSKMTAAQTVDVTDARTTAGMAALVSAGLITQGRSTQVLNLTLASP